MESASLQAWPSARPRAEHLDDFPFWIEDDYQREAEIIGHLLRIALRIFEMFEFSFEGSIGELAIVFDGSDSKSEFGAVSLRLPAHSAVDLTAHPRVEGVKVVVAPAASSRTKFWPLDLIVPTADITMDLDDSTMRESISSRMARRDLVPDEEAMVADVGIGFRTAIHLVLTQQVSNYTLFGSVRRPCLRSRNLLDGHFADHPGFGVRVVGPHHHPELAVVSGQGSWRDDDPVFGTSDHADGAQMRAGVTDDISDLEFGLRIY